MTEQKTTKNRGPLRLEPKEIVMSAYKYLSDVTTVEKISAVRIEELEPLEGGKFWNVVLSYDAVGEFPFDKKREYKEFRVDAFTGTVISMKIKKI